MTKEQIKAFENKLNELYNEYDNLCDKRSKATPAQKGNYNHPVSATAGKIIAVKECLDILGYRAAWVYDETSGKTIINIVTERAFFTRKDIVSA